MSATGMCYLCKSSKCHPGSHFCSIACRDQACIVCEKSPKFLPHQYCSKTCAQGIQATAGQLCACGSQCGKNVHPGSTTCSLNCRNGKCGHTPLNTTKTFTGSGVVPWMMYYNNTAKQFTKVVILVRDRKTKQWMLPGGYKQPGKTLIGTAWAEMWEEACIDSSQVVPGNHPQIDMVDKKNTCFRSYVAQIKSGVSRTKTFGAEMNKREANPATPHDYLETDRMEFVSVSAIKAALSQSATNHNVTVANIEGKHLGDMRPVSAKVLRVALKYL